MLLSFFLSRFASLDSMPPRSRCLHVIARCCSQCHKISVRVTRPLFVVATLVFFGSAVPSSAQFEPGGVAVTPSTSNTTSACNASPQPPGVGCSTTFEGLTDHYPSISGPPAPHVDTIVTVPPAANVSSVPFSAFLPSNAGTEIVCHFQIWWGSPLHHGNPMDQSNPQIVDRQIRNAITRGCNQVVFDWYGPGAAKGIVEHPDAAFQNHIVQLWQSNLNARCRAADGACPLRFALMEDVGTETGRAQLGSFESDLQYAWLEYMNSPSYWTISAGDCSERPVFLAFGWGWTDVSASGASWHGLKDWIHSGEGLNLRCAREPLVVINGEEGLRDANTDGSYNWIGVNNYSDHWPGTVGIPGVSGSGQFDTHFEAGSEYSETDWLREAGQSSKLVKIASVYPGFNNTNTTYGFNAAAGHPYGWKLSRECGLVWIRSWSQIKSASLLSSASSIGYVGIVTWNDYEEGTAIEPGIDNCLEDDSIHATIQGRSIEWSYRFASSHQAHISGSPLTIHHYALWQRRGINWTELSNPLAGLQDVRCLRTDHSSYHCHAPLPLKMGKPEQQTFYLQIVGQPSIRNHLSPPISIKQPPQ